MTERDNANGLAKEFLEMMFTTDDVEEWMQKLKDKPEVRQWASDQFKKVSEVQDD
jgi:hypothetical protein